MSNLEDLENLIILGEEEISEEAEISSSIEALANWILEHCELQEKILDYLEGLSDLPELGLDKTGRAVQKPPSISQKIREWYQQGYSIDQMVRGAAALGSSHPYELVRTTLRRLQKGEDHGRRSS